MATGTATMQDRLHEMIRPQHLDALVDRYSPEQLHRHGRSAWNLFLAAPI